MSLSGHVGRRRSWREPKLYGDLMLGFTNIGDKWINGRGKRTHRRDGVDIPHSMPSRRVDSLKKVIKWW